jgi:hypothetical protein
VPQYSITGELICPGHVGIIYQAANAAKLGRSRARIQKVLPDVIWGRAVLRVADLRLCVEDAVLDGLVGLA